VLFVEDTTFYMFLPIFIVHIVYKNTRVPNLLFALNTLDLLGKRSHSIKVLLFTKLTWTKIDPLNKGFAIYHMGSSYFSCLTKVELDVSGNKLVRKIS